MLTLKNTVDISKSSADTFTSARQKPHRIFVRIAVLLKSNADVNDPPNNKRVSYFWDKIRIKNHFFFKFTIWIYISLHKFVELTILIFMKWIDNHISMIDQRLDVTSDDTDCRGVSGQRVNGGASATPMDGHTQTHIALAKHWICMKHCTKCIREARFLGNRLI